MPFEYLTPKALDEALAEYLSLLGSKGMQPTVETVKTSEGCGRVTAKAVYANICSPHFNASAMDGIAVRASDTFGATETTPVYLPPEKFTRLDTGDPIPDDCDAVVMIEDVVEAENDGVRLYAAATPWQHVRQIGEDICAGDMILPSFTRLTAPALGAMLAGGVLEFEAVKKPVVGIIPTGDEIVPPTADPKKGDLIEFNSTIFSGILSQWGAIPKCYPIVKDVFADIVSALETALSECDAVILNAGSSAGREDFSSRAIATVGEVYCHGIAIRPGKPAILGCAGSKPVLGVPGYPVSGIIVLEQIMKPVIDLLTAEPNPEQDAYAEATLSKRVNSPLKYREFVRARLGAVGGKLVAVPLAKGASVITSFVKADGIIDIPQNSEGCEAGDTVRVRLLRPMEEVENMLVVTGSHDPLIDEAADFLRREFGGSVASTHVGSMGGITAIRRGEAHMGGCHLLTEADGSYNISYLRKYFKPGEVKLIRCVDRVQGIMVPKGNPMNIQSVKDLAREGVRFVNRQKGSGTRILLDYLLKRDGVNAEDIYGYTREEFTHTGVAAIVAAGSGDAGLGIYSAAQLYGLDFIPVYNEEYDLLVLSSAFESEGVQRFLQVLRSDAFRARLEEMGGYGVKAPGEIIEWEK